MLRRLFAELREALAGGRPLDEAKDFKRSRHKHLRQPGQPVPGVQFLFEASDLTTEVTAKAKRQKNSTCENEADGAQRRPSTKRALFSDQYSELDDEITGLLSRQKPEDDVFSLDKQAFEA